jgi:SAM-dependent methyltransferase
VCGVSVTGEGAESDRIVEWREARDAATLGRARDFLARLDASVPTVDALPVEELPEDPVLLIAPVVEASRCHVDPETGQSCRSFHLPRTWFRILGTMGGTTAHRDLYEHGLAPLLREGERPRILVSATADHSLPALLLFLARRAGAEAALTVSDLCPTPLAVTRWYAEHVGESVETVAADAAESAALGPFDAICTHLFLGWVPPERRPALLSQWASMLRPGGRVVTSASLARGPGSGRGGDGRRRIRPELLERFEAMSRSRARAWKDFLGVDPEVVGAMAKQFLPTWRSRFPQETRESLAELFDRAGFDLEVEIRERPPLRSPHWNPAPELEAAEGARRLEARLLATRR